MSFTSEGWGNRNTSVTTFIHNLSFFKKALDKQSKICSATLEYALFKEDALMNNYPTLVKEKLYSLIDDITDVSWLYCTNHGIF